MTKSKLFISVLILSFLAGCSNYKVGHLMHPQIKTIGFGKILNKTDQPRLSLYMMEKLKERFMQDASIKVVASDKADVILTGIVTDTKISSRGRTHQDDREKNEGFFATIFSADLTFEYEVKTRKGWDVLKGKVTEGADFTELIDQHEEKKNALQRAAYEVSKKVVVEITEAW